MTEQERQEHMEKLFEKMLNMEMTNREMYEQCRNVAHEPMTEEEWLRTATTEQLAEEILAWWFDGANTYSEFGLYSREIDEAKEKIVEWLKQPHQ